MVYNPLFFLPRRDLVMAREGEIPGPVEEDNENE
jgi:hypothetical protein